MTVIFGLKNSPAFFATLTNKILGGYTGKFCSIYIDDIIFWSQTFEEHLNHLSQIFDRFKKANLKLKPTKCHFAKPEVLYLGHIISKDGIKVDPSKTNAVKTFPMPRNQHDIRSFLGLCNYYRKFVKNYSKITNPLNKLLVKDTKFKWTSKCQDAFEFLKEKLINAPILASPDMNKPFILTCDASKSAVGYILSQLGDDNKEHVISYNGRSLRPSEKNYGITELECLSVIDAVEHYYVYLTSQPFKIITDHQAIKYIQNFKHQNPRLMRWSLKLQNWDFTVEYKPGSKNTDADCLSRRPYKPEQEEGEHNPRGLEDIPDPREIIEITFDD